MGKKRHGLKRSKSKKLFKRTSRTHKKNALTRPMRGGIRL